MHHGSTVRRVVRHSLRHSLRNVVRGGGLVAVLAGVTTVMARSLQGQQGMRIGMIAGANFSELRGLDDVELDRRTSSMGGLSLVLPLGGVFALQPEALVVTAGGEPVDATGDGLTLTYAQIPLLLRLSAGLGAPLSPHVYAGPYVGLQLRCRVDVAGVSGNCDDVPGISTNTVDAGGIVGGGLDLHLGALVLTGGVRYGFGVSKVADFDTEGVRESASNGSYAVYAGLSVRFGGR